MIVLEFSIRSALPRTSHISAGQVGDFYIIFDFFGVIGYNVCSGVFNRFFVCLGY